MVYVTFTGRYADDKVKRIIDDLGSISAYLGNIGIRDQHLAFVETTINDTKSDIVRGYVRKNLDDRTVVESLRTLRELAEDNIVTGDVSRQL